MTQEEVTKRLKALKARCERLIVSSSAGNPEEWRKDAEAIDMAITALRPVSQEQVEKVFPGCRSCKSCRSCVFSIHAIKDMPCKKCDPNAEYVLTEYKPSKFCPVCGKPLTDEAVEMVMERLEEMYENQ